MKKTLALLALITLTVAGCGGDSEAGKANANGSEKSGWTQELKSSFLTQCSIGLIGKIIEKTTRDSLCSCVLDDLKKLYTPDQVQENTSQAKSDVTRITTACVNKITQSQQPSSSN